MAQKKQAGQAKIEKLGSKRPRLRRRPLVTKQWLSRTKTQPDSSYVATALGHNLEAGCMRLVIDIHDGTNTVSWDATVPHGNPKALGPFVSAMNKLASTIDSLCATALAEHNKTLPD